MIYGIGTDLIETDRFTKKIQKNSSNFLTRLFSEKEIEYCRKGALIRTRAQCFAGRFVAKEAFLKALGTGLRNGLRWTDIEITNNSLGKPLIKLYNKAEQTVEDEHIRNIHVSISHVKNQASAIVILEK